MKLIVVLSLIVAVVSAGNWNSGDRNNRDKLTERDAKHQKFVIDLLRHLQDDIQHKDFLQYSESIRLDNKGDYKDLNKVYYVVNLFQNGWFEDRGKPFSLFRERNIITTKALFDFFDTMNDWNTCAMNLIWARRNINEYQFWHLMTLLTTHNRHFNNVVLPSAYEVFPTQFFTADVIDQATQVRLSRDNNKIVMSNYTTGVLGSNDNDDNDNINDLNEIKNGKNKINDWNTLKQVMNDIKIQLRRNNNNQWTNKKNKDIRNKIQNNNRNLNQGNKFDNNGEDRLVYFTEDIGLNNYYYFSRMGNSRIVDNKQMYDNENNKESFNKKNGKTIDRKEFDDKINRRGERYLYQMKQLLARFNLERKSNGLDNVQDITLDGVVDNGVYANLRYTNGLQMPNRQNEFHLKKQQNTRLIQVTKDFENRFLRVIDQGYVETQNGHKVDLRNKNGINILGNLMQGNRDSVNNQYYRYLEYYYRLLLGGNNNDKVDFDDNRFVPTVMDHYETSMRDSVFWQMCKRITSIVNKFTNKLVGYKTRDVDFDGVKINNVKVDKLVTTFSYFDSDLTNGIKLNKNDDLKCNKDNSNSNEGDSNESNDSYGSDSDSNSDEDMNGRIVRNGRNDYVKRDDDRNNRNNDSNESNNSSDDSNDSNSNESTGRREDNYRNGNRDMNRNGDRNGRDNTRNGDRNGRDMNRNGDRNGRDMDRNGDRNGRDMNRNGDRKGRDNNRNGDRYGRDMNGNEDRNGRDMNRNGDRNERDMNRDNGRDMDRNGDRNTFNFQGVSKQVDYYRRTGNNGGNMNSWKNTIVGRTRRMETKQFTVTIDVDSNKNQNGIVRIFLGPRINNKQQLDDNRHNFVELDQFIVKLNQGQNIIKRNSRDFKNVVGEPETMTDIYFRALNLLNKKNNDNDLNKLNFDTNNNNQGFPHRLVLPKGTVGGEDYTLYVICSDLKNDDTRVQYRDNLNTFNLNKRITRDSNESDNSDNSNSNESNSSNDSNSNESDSNESRDGRDNRNGRDNRDERNGRDNRDERNGRDNRDERYNRDERNGRDNRDVDTNRNGRGNWEKNNGVMIHNNNNGNKNCGNGNGVLDTRAMGFPLDRQIVDVTGFITKNMYFKDVKIFHNDNSNNY